MPGAMRLRLSSAARMRRPVTTGDKARTTCSTSGSSGIDYSFDLLPDVINQSILAGLNIQAQQWFGVRAADIKAPLCSLERVAISKIFLSLAVKFLLHFLDH